METQNRDWSSILEKCFNNTRYRGTLEKEKRLIEELAEKGNLGKNVTVLCCGDGREMGDILDANKKYPQVEKLIGIDLLETSIQQVQEQIDGVWGEYDVEVEVKKEDAIATSIDKHTQDTIFILLTMVNFDNEFIDNILSHVYELLKPDGRFVFSVFNEHALYTRMQVYEGVAPIKWVTNDGFVKFKDGWDEAEYSRQFSNSDVADICQRSGFACPIIDSSYITHLAVVQKQSYVDQLNAQRRNKALMACAMLLMFANNIDVNQLKNECHGAITTMEVAPGGGTYDFCVRNTSLDFNKFIVYPFKVSP
jgi:SAM-dependent methyltransferase